MRTSQISDISNPAEEVATLMATFLNPETNCQMAERCREMFISDFAEPLIRKIVKRTMHVDPGLPTGQRTIRDEHARDAYGEATILVCRALEAWRSGKAQAPDRFLDYVAIIAYRACGRVLNHDEALAVEYLLTHQRGFALWIEKDQLRVGGYESWKEEERASASPDVLDDLYRDPEAFAGKGLRKRHPRKTLGACNEVERLMALLDQADAPIELGALTAAYQALEEAFPHNLRSVSLSAVMPHEDAGYDLAEPSMELDPGANVIEAE